MKVRALVVFALGLVLSIPMIAQTTCSSTMYTNTLICTLPQLYGPQGLTLANPGHFAHFAESSAQSLSIPVSLGIGQELSILPLGSSGSGPTFTLDSEGNLTSTDDSLGPILTERANVIGKKAFSLGVAYQYFSFDKLDGIDLHNYQAVLTHEGWTDQLSVGPQVFKQDYIKTANQISLNLNQTVIYGVVGITKRVDASIELPIQATHFRVISQAQIVRTQPCEFTQNCSEIDPTTHVDAATCGEFHYFEGNQNNCALVFTSLKATFPYPGAVGLITPSGSTTPVLGPSRQGPPVQDATGIGDITVRGKFEMIHRENLVGSVGLGIRFPTGDAKNFLGTGAYGVIPFGALTYRSGRFSPHVRFGYEWNSRSILAGAAAFSDTQTFFAPASASLPAEWLYSGGADYRVTKWLTIAADVIGERVLDVQRVSLSSYNLLPQTTGENPTDADKAPVPSVILGTSSPGYSSDAIAVGGKLRLGKATQKGQLVLVGNATIRVDDGGLRANVVPLVGLSWSK
jgi:hypothetical protein